VEAAAACALLDVLQEQQEPTQLSDYRIKLDCTDRSLLRAFDERMRISGDIGIWKKEHDTAVLDAYREKEKLDSVSELSTYPEAAQELYRLLMRLSREEQMKL